MSDLAKVGFSVPANQPATTPDTQNWPICPDAGGPPSPRYVPRAHVLVRNPLVSLARSFVTDGRLSIEARGLMLVMCTLPEGVSIEADTILPLCPGWGPSDVESALDNLRQTGYLYADGYGDWIITDVPGAEQSDVLVPSFPPAPPKLKTVYFVERENLIKIGITGNLENRLKGLSSGGSMPQGMTVGPVVLLATEPGDEAHEQRLHERFAEWRIGGTEWFWPSQPLRAYVAGLQASGSAR
jgi:hypothetical protein